jgi:nucleotide-binding universal stress UspA family protein
MSKTILVPVDGSEHSKKALEFAAELGTKFEGQLSAAAITVHTTGDELEDVGVKVIAAAREIAAAHGCTDVEAKAVLGDPASEIVERAREIDADMIVMGSRGLSDLTGLLMGSVSHKVAHLAPCTCVTVR